MYFELYIYIIDLYIFIIDVFVISWFFFRFGLIGNCFRYNNVLFLGYDIYRIMYLWKGFYFLLKMII